MENPETHSPSASQFHIQRLYVIEQSCKLKHTPAIFKEDWNPEISMEVHVKKIPVEDALYEVILHLTIVGKINGLSAFSVEVQQAGLFMLQGYSDEQLEALLTTYCPSILYPYARKVVASATQETSLPALTLMPINFEVFYSEQQRRRTQPDETRESSSPSEETKREMLS